MNLLHIKFNSDIVDVIDNGRHWISIYKICENLGISPFRQVTKLKSDPTYEAKLLKVQTAGGVQEVFCIPLDKLNGWLFTINPNRVKPETKEKLIAYKNECFKVLYNHFLAKTQNQLTNCPASDNLNSRINGYKGMLARKQKEIDELRFKLLICQDEVKSIKEKNDPIRWIVEHNLLDLAREIAKHNISLSNKEKELEIMSKELAQPAQNAQYFLEHITKYFPKANNVAETAMKLK